MNITGIIAEYNPLHNGHAYQLTQARKETDADYIIIVMSGNFVQRGAPALLDKFTRAKMALFAGADLVIELPPLWATASAEYFAGAGIALLHQLGCVDSLCYGCETPSGHLFEKICAVLCNETPPYRQLLANALKSGSSYALARQSAVLALLPAADHAAATAVLKNPNNILALEYQKAIRKQSSPLKACPILRQGQGYHSGCLSGPFLSASAIRRFLASQPANAGQTLREAMPLFAYRLLADYQGNYPLLYENDCSQMLHYCLLKNAADGFSRYADCTPGLSNKICRNLKDYTGFSDFCALLKSKDLTYARISRVLLHILLDIRQSDYTLWRSHSFVPYARILGFRRQSRDLLMQLKKHAAIPLLARAADVKKLSAGKKEHDFLQKSLFAESVYRALAVEKGGIGMKQEFQQQVVII